jgi:FtsZ-binding cell division protein ZapB
MSQKTEGFMPAGLCPVFVIIPVENTPVNDIPLITANVENTTKSIENTTKSIENTTTSNVEPFGSGVIGAVAEVLESSNKIILNNPNIENNNSNTTSSTSQQPLSFDINSESTPIAPEISTTTTTPIAPEISTTTAPEISTTTTKPITTTATLATSSTTTQQSELLDKIEISDEELENAIYIFSYEAPNTHQINTFLKEYKNKYGKPVCETSVKNIFNKYSVALKNQFKNDLLNDNDYLYNVIINKVKYDFYITDKNYVSDENCSELTNDEYEKMENMVRKFIYKLILYIFIFKIGRKLNMTERINDYIEEETDNIRGENPDISIHQRSMLYEQIRKFINENKPEPTTTTVNCEIYNEIKTLNEKIIDLETQNNKLAGEHTTKLNKLNNILSTINSELRKIRGKARPVKRRKLREERAKVEQQIIDLDKYTNTITQNIQTITNYQRQITEYKESIGDNNDYEQLKNKCKGTLGSDNFEGFGDTINTSVLKTDVLMYVPLLVLLIFLLVIFLQQRK